MNMKKIIAIFSVGAMLCSSLFVVPMCLTSSAEETTYKTKEEYVASLVTKKVTVDYQVDIETDEWGIFTAEDVREYIRFGLFTAEKITYNNDESSIPANKMLVDMGLIPIETSPFGNTKRVLFQDLELPKGKYYIKQIDGHNIFSVSEKRIYFTVGNDIHNEDEYIDLTSESQTIHLLTCKPNVVANYEDNMLEGVSLRVTSIAESDNHNTVNVYKGISDDVGEYFDFPSLPIGRYTFTFSADNYYFKPITVEVTPSHLNNSATLYVRAEGILVSSDSDISDTDSSTDDTKKVKELEAKVSELEAKNSDLEKKISEYEAKESNDVAEKSAHEKELEAKISELEAEIATYKEKESSDSEAKSKREKELETKVSELEAEIATYKEKESSDSEAKSKREKELEAKVSEYEAVIADYKAKYGVFGDIDGDGIITSTDALILLRRSVGLPSILDSIGGV